VFNFGGLKKNWLRMNSDFMEWQTLHYKTYKGPVWPHLVNGDYAWSRIWSMNDLVHIQAEVSIGLRYQVMAEMVLWCKIEQIWSYVAYNGPIFVIVSRYDRLGPYLPLCYLFWAILALSIRFDHFAIKVPGKRENYQKWSIIQYVLL